jgi:hypothetical protein
MKKTSHLKLVRITRETGDALVKYLQERNGRTPLELINAGRFIDLSVREKMQREPVKQ